MTVPAGTFQTYQAKGIREDLSDLIFNISPTERPFTSAIRKTKATQSRHEWQTDTLATASASNALVEGDDAIINTAVPTVRLANFLQTLGKSVSVAGKQRAVRTAGRADEFQYQLKKRMAELGNDLESSLTQNNAATAGSAASAPLMAGAESWLSSNKTSVGQTTTFATTPGADATLGYPATAPTDATTAGTLTEAAFKAVIREIYNASNADVAKIAMCAMTVKQKISSTFTGIATRFLTVSQGEQAQITAGADVYVSDAGRMMIVPNRFMRDKTLLIINPEYWGIASLRPFGMERLAKTGDSDKAQIVGDYTLECRNEKASGKVTDINGLL